MCHKSLSASGRFSTLTAMRNFSDPCLSQKPFGFRSVFDNLAESLGKAIVKAGHKSLSASGRFSTKFHNMEFLHPFSVTKAFRLQVGFRPARALQKLLEGKRVTKAFRLQVGFRHDWFLKEYRRLSSSHKSLSASGRFSTKQSL